MYESCNKSIYIESVSILIPYHHSAAPFKGIITSRADNVLICAGAGLAALSVSRLLGLLLSAVIS